ncbi:MAG: helix-hairpin-helix domain-containing protein [Myxococcota bacterium]|nr:helix-hairpin-helix domain-containing protein [Myxococcota bacterium]
MQKRIHRLAPWVLVALISLASSAMAAEGASNTAKVNVNTATEVELAYLPGIGPSKAAAIAKYRTKRPFSKIEELMRVKGIGRKTFNKMRQHLTVKGVTTLKADLTPTK